MKNTFNILAIETSGDSGGAAIVCPIRGVLSEVCTAGDRTHGALLVPCIDRAVREAGIEKSDLSGIVVNAGPGSYTGLRIGVAAAEAISLALEIPSIGVPGFEVMCEEWIRQQRESGKTDDLRVVLIPALDARQDACSAAAFDWDVQTNRLQRLCDDVLVPPEEIASIVHSANDLPSNSNCETPIIVFGQAATIYRERFPAQVIVQPERIDIRPASVGMAALRYWNDIAATLEASRDKRVDIRYFRPISAKTIAERQAVS